MGVADAAVDGGGAHALAHHGGRHHAAPRGGARVVRRIPQHKGILAHVVEHLAAKTHLAADDGVGGALHGEGDAGQGTVFTQQDQVVGD